MDIISGLAFKPRIAQIGLVVPDIHVGCSFLENVFGIKKFHRVKQVRAQDLGMTYYGKVVEAEWLSAMTTSEISFIELIQPISGQSIYHDYLAKYPAGGTQNIGFHLVVEDYRKVVAEIRRKGYKAISKSKDPRAKMTFFDTYKTLGVSTVIMGITHEGWQFIMRETGMYL